MQTRKRQRGGVAAVDYDDLAVAPPPLPMSMEREDASSRGGEEESDDASSCSNDQEAEEDYGLEVETTQQQEEDEEDASSDTESVHSAASDEALLSDVAAVLSANGVALPPRSARLYRRALTHKSAARSALHSNETLEYVGDGQIEGAFKLHTALRFPQLQEHRQSLLKVAAVRNLTAGRVAAAIGLPRLYRTAPGPAREALLRDPKALGDLFEAFVGAIAVDYHDARIGLREAAGMAHWCAYWPAAADATTTTTVEGAGGVWTELGVGPGRLLAQAFAEAAYAKHADWTALLASETNFKGVLQERLQREVGQAPVYRWRAAPGGKIQMSVWWEWGVDRDGRRPGAGSAYGDFQPRATVTLAEIPSFDALRLLKSGCVRLLLAAAPARRGALRDAEQEAARLACEVLPASHAAGARRVRPPAPNPDRGEAAAQQRESGGGNGRRRNLLPAAESPPPPPAEEASSTSLAYRATSLRGRAAVAALAPGARYERYMGPAAPPHGLGGRRRHV